jgi:two-component SAPR family response regulator
MKAVIVDDEYYALKGLGMELEDIEGIEVVGMYEDGQRMLEEFGKVNPDVVFLDIEMPKMDGFELLKKLLEAGVTPNIVFVTAYSHYAVKAFEINAVDYIVKPVTKDRLLKTLERIKPDIKMPDKRRIEIKCFRHFSIMADSKEINKGWRTGKAEELIAYLLCEKGRFVSKDKIAEALWPDLDGEKSVANLYLAYYYIKKQDSKTGIKIPIESERGKMRIRLEETDCDMVSFERLVEASTDTDSSNRIELMESAVRLYKGSFLEDRYYSWAVDFQQKYEVEFTELLKYLIGYFGQQSDTEKMKYYEEKYNALF